MATLDIIQIIIMLLIYYIYKQFLITMLTLRQYFSTCYQTTRLDIYK